MKLLTNSSFLVGACLNASLLPMQLHAQTPGDTAPEEIIVAANRIEQPLSTVLAATTVINKETIRRSQAQNLAGLLAGVPGMQFSPSGGQGAQTSLFMRGTESDHTLILVDGVQMTTNSGTAGRLEFIPLDQIERIEIVRGPRSSVYGSEAIGGVVNIITKPNIQEDFSGSVKLMAGTENSSDANIGLQGRVGKSTLSLNASRRETDGIDNSERGSSDDDGYENESLSLSFSHQFSELFSLSSTYSSFDAQSDYDDGVVNTDSQQFSTTVKASFTEQWDSNFIFEQFKEDSMDVGAFGITNSSSENKKLSWQNTYTFNASNLLSFGIDHQEQELRYASFGAVQTDTSRDNDGVYGVYIRESGPVDFTLSFRNDDNERFGNHSTGSIALGRDFGESVRAWVSYGTAFKAPNLIDLYVDFPSFFFFANPNLKPETAESVELSLQAEVLGATWQINVFRNDIDDLISTDATFTSLANIQEARIDGMEATVTSNVAGWRLDAALTFLDHENRSTGVNLLRRPEQTLSLNIAREFGALEIAVNVLAQNEHLDINPVNFGASTVGGYGVVNLLAGYRLSDDLSLRLRIGNFLDKEYQIVDGFNTQGRTAQLSLNYSF
ncbi:MAG: TonB-dependent receptor [Gammaproteobacteria bacterium]|nr:TonB-dependent receptor [Gammaproteobacteria bacterium]